MGDEAFQASGYISFGDTRQTELILIPLPENYEPPSTLPFVSKDWEGTGFLSVYGQSNINKPVQFKKIVGRNSSYGKNFIKLGEKDSVTNPGDSGGAVVWEDPQTLKKYVVGAIHGNYEKGGDSENVAIKVSNKKITTKLRKGTYKQIRLNCS